MEGGLRDTQEVLSTPPKVRSQEKKRSGGKKEARGHRDGRQEGWSPPSARRGRDETAEGHRCVGGGAPREGRCRHSRPQTWTPSPQPDGPPRSPEGPDALCSEEARLTLPWRVQKGGSSVPGSNPVVSFANRGALSQGFAFCISVGGPVRATATPIWQGC